tara:strand:+ start:2229 stop:2540 length:312 start_codon:yes stop_codon:yes gene_type:complete
MIYMVDIDGTICYTTGSNYEESRPIQERIDHFNKLYDEGHEINYWTARGSKSGTDWHGFTKAQLLSWGVKFTTLKLGKPHYDIWIDDKAQNDKEYFRNKRYTG